jgi:hypothetical protein
MDEGIAGYVSYTALMDSAYADEVAAWSDAQFALVRQAQASGGWLDLLSISTRADWNAAQAQYPGLPVAEAFVVVKYIAENYGLEKCTAIFIDVSHYGNVSGAVSKVLDISIAELQTAVQKWMRADKIT